MFSSWLPVRYISHHDINRHLGQFHSLRQLLLYMLGKLRRKFRDIGLAAGCQSKRYGKRCPFFMVFLPAP
jgi:hypothetical protein